MYAYKKVLAVHYDGTNSAEVLAAAQQIITGNSYSIAGEDEFGMHLREEWNPSQGYNYFVALNQVIVIEPGAGIVDRTTPARFAAVYRTDDAVYMDAAAKPDVLSSLKSQIYNQYECGHVALPSLLLGASTTLSVPFTGGGSFVDTTYVVKTRAMTGASVLSAIQVTNVVKNTNSVQVTVKANGVATVAGLLLVDCFR